MANLVTTIEQINPPKSKPNKLCPKVCLMSNRCFSALKCKTKMLANMYLDAELKSGKQDMKDNLALERENSGKG